MSLFDAWISLKHGGQLLSPTELETLPEADERPWNLTTKLRAELINLMSAREGKKKYTVPSTLLTLILEGACGLTGSWEKESELKAYDELSLIDGTRFKPDRRRSGHEQEALVVKTTDVARIGVGRGRRPVAHMLEYLRRSKVSLGLLTNGTQWRLIWADEDSTACVEWEAERWLDGDQLTGELEVLRRLLSFASLKKAEEGQAPLIDAIRDSRRGQVDLTKELGERVRRSVELLLRSRSHAINDAWGDHHSSDLYVSSCKFVMRLVVILFAEARELLPVDNPVYHQAYGLRGLFDQLNRLTPERRKTRQSAWPRLLALFKLLHQGSPHPELNVPAYGGDLFAQGTPEGSALQRSMVLLEDLDHPPHDDVIFELLKLLTITTQRVREGRAWAKRPVPVDFTELTSEYIGILYEGLLDYELHRVSDEPILFLNLGDQPALPLDRLEGMDDKTLKGLVEKAKVKASAEDSSDDEGNEGEEDVDDESQADFVDDEAEEDQPHEDDERQALLERSYAWAKRAATVAKLVKKPKGKNPEKLAEYEKKLDQVSKQLIADLKLPGELYLVRWGGTRKGAGTFYTRPQLVRPTVRRTLEPLIYEQSDEGRVIKSPEEILALKVCDPAMGSGSFPVSVLYVLTEAVIESLHHHGRVKREEKRVTIRCEVLPKADQKFEVGDDDAHLKSVVRRAVVEHCIYGVDLDPLAVELARVALWIETLDKRLPFTFLDHKLRCGNALVGTWLDRFRDYPLLCFERTSPDEKYKGVHYPANVWRDALKAKKASAIAEQVSVITGDLIRKEEDYTELTEQIAKVRSIYRELRAVPAGRPDLRAKIWRRVQGNQSLQAVRRAFDTWCSLWFWPLDQLDVMPTPLNQLAPTEEAKSVVAGLTERHRFFHWELEFPDVFVEQGSGFSAIVGNPPWEIQKPNSKEFFSNHDPLYRSYGKQEALREQKTLFERHPEIEEAWLDYNGDFKARGNFISHVAEPFGDAKRRLQKIEEAEKRGEELSLGARHEGGSLSLVPRKWRESDKRHQEWYKLRVKYKRHLGLSDPLHGYRYQGSADLNTYKMFVEQGHALLRRGGQLGFVIPSGIYTDKGTQTLRELLLRECKWRWLYGFENRDKIFDIHRSFKFCVLIAEKGSSTESIQAAFMRHALEDWQELKNLISYPKKDIAYFSPISKSLIEFNSLEHQLITKRQFGSSIVIGKLADIGIVIHNASGLHMTNKSSLFPPLQDWQDRGYQDTGIGVWEDAFGNIALPLIQGAMIWQYDSWFFNGSTRLNLALNHKGLLGLSPPPKYLIQPNDREQVPLIETSKRIGYRDVQNATNQRTFIGTILPPFPAGNTINYITSGDEATDSFILASLSSFPTDYMLRNKMSQNHVNWFYVEELPIPIDLTKKRIIIKLSPLVQKLALVGLQSSLGVPPQDIELLDQKSWAITNHERLRLRSMIDATVASLYGLNRDDFAWILKDCDHPTRSSTNRDFCKLLDPKGFWRVDKTEDPELRHTVLSLKAFDDLQAFIEEAGDRDAGIEAFCDQNNGDGWMLPETLCIKDLGMTRSLDVGVYDERAQTAQPVRERMGERFLPWQLEQTPEESWAECERHAKAIREMMPAPLIESTSATKPKKSEQQQLDLFGGDH